MKTFAATIVVAAVLLVVPAGALATNASDGAGQTFGQHHDTMAQGGSLGADMNPGMHNGFSGWTPM